MTTERRFKSWNIFDSGLNSAARGHNYWETKGLVDELMRRGETVRLFSHVNAPPAELFPEVRLVPTFSQFLYKTFSNDPSWQTLENFILHNWYFLQDLSKLEPSLFHGSILLLPTIGRSPLRMFWLYGSTRRHRLGQRESSGNPIPQRDSTVS